MLKSLCSVQFSRSVMSDSLRPHELQHDRPPCPSQTPGVYSNSCPLSRWCHPAISSSVIPFSSCPQSLPTSGSFPMSQLFTWGGQSIGVSASASVLPMNTRTDLLQDGLAGSPCNPWLCRHNKLWKILKEMGIPDHLTCLLRNLYAAQEPTVRTAHGTVDWFKIGEGVCQSCIYNGYNLSKLWENRGAWHAAVHGVTKSWTWLSDWITTTTTTWESQCHILTVCEPPSHLTFGFLSLLKCKSEILKIITGQALC